MSFDCQFFVEIRKHTKLCTPMCGTESTAARNSGIGVKDALLNPHSVF
jgi:hypothetical protein